METILIITKKEMFSDSGRNYIRNKVRKFKNPFFDISFNLIYNIYIYNIKLISHYHYGVVVYNFTHPKKWNILKVCEKIHYMCVCVCG